MSAPAPLPPPRSRAARLRRAASVAWWFLADWVYAVRWQVEGLARGESAELHRNPPEARGLPVVLVPGVFESWRFLRPLTEALHAAGHPVHVVQELGHNTGEVPRMAAAVRRLVDARQLRAVVVVAHSKGGLIGKHLLVHHNADGAVRHLVAVNTPFSGSALARYLPGRVLRVFAPGGPLLVELASSTGVDRSITSVYSEVDPNIPGGSHLPGATNVCIEGAVGHFRVLSDPRVQAAVLAALRAVPA
jgi:triacylglycerol lipase